MGMIRIFCWNNLIRLARPAAEESIGDPDGDPESCDGDSDLTASLAKCWLASFNTV